MNNNEIEMLENLGEFKALIEGCNYTTDERLIRINYRDYKEYFSLDSNGHINGLIYSKREASDIDWVLLTRCTSIKHLTLRDCSLESFPTELALMPDLLSLDLAYNKLESIEFDFSIFNKLQNLDFP